MDSSNITHIEDLLSSYESKFLYLDESKKQKTLLVHNQEESNTKSACWWCTYKFDSAPIGAPIRYVSSIGERTIALLQQQNCSSHIVIRETVDTDIDSSKTLKVLPKNYYVVTGCFCSFNCCLAFIRDKKKEKEYKFSELYLNNIKKTLTNNIDEYLYPASHWLTLKKFGGSLSIEEFRRNFSCFIEKEDLLLVKTSNLLRVTTIF